MNETEQALHTLAQMTAANDAKLVMLRETMAALIARIAAEYEDPETFITTLCMTASEAAREFAEDDDPGSAGRMIDDFALKLESAAHLLLRP